MDTLKDSASLTKGLLEGEVIDLEPSLELEVASSAERRPGIDVGSVQGSAGSLSCVPNRSAAAAWARLRYFSLWFTWCSLCGAFWVMAPNSGSYP